MRGLFVQNEVSARANRPARSTDGRCVSRYVVPRREATAACGFAWGVATAGCDINRWAAAVPGRKVGSQQRASARKSDGGPERGHERGDFFSLGIFRLAHPTSPIVFFLNGFIETHFPRSELGRPLRMPDANPPPAGFGGRISRSDAQKPRQ